MDTTKYISDYNYSIVLPKDWAEYETDEENTNAFFDTVYWSGNLRITPLKHKIENSENFFANEISEKVKWSKIQGIFYIQKSETDTIYFWELSQNEKLFLCSFTLGEVEEEKIDGEIEKVQNILKTIVTE